MISTLRKAPAQSHARSAHLDWRFPSHCHIQKSACLHCIDQVPSEASIEAKTIGRHLPYAMFWRIRHEVRVRKQYQSMAPMMHATVEGRTDPRVWPDHFPRALEPISMGAGAAETQSPFCVSLFCRFSVPV